MARGDFVFAGLIETERVTDPAIVHGFTHGHVKIVAAYIGDAARSAASDRICCWSGVGLYTPFSSTV